MLPNQIHPAYGIEQKSTGKKIKFRPYLVKENKLLLIAKESTDISEIFDTIKQVLKNCCLDPNFTEQIDKIPLFDLEYFFINLRGVSAGSTEKFQAVDTEDGQTYPFVINFTDVNVIFPDPKPDPKIKIGDDLVLVMRYPTASIYNDKEAIENVKKNDIFDLVMNCVDKIYQNDEPLDFDKKELEGFLDNLDIQSFNKIKNFLLNMPKLVFTQKYKNSLDHERELRLESLMDFFPYL